MSSSAAASFQQQGLTLLSGSLTWPVIDAWRVFERHADACAGCRPAAAELREVPDIPHPAFESCCPVGQQLFSGWADAKMELIERLKELTAPWGLAGLEDPEPRAAALTALPAAGARDVFETSDPELREAKIRAVMSAYQAAGKPREPLICPECSKTFVPEYARQQYCSGACRKRAFDRRKRQGETPRKLFSVLGDDD